MSGFSLFAVCILAKPFPTETERWDEYEYERLQLSTYVMYESYAYWKLAIEQLTLDLVVVIVYFGLVDLR